MTKLVQLATLLERKSRSPKHSEGQRRAYADAARRLRAILVTLLALACLACGPSRLDHVERAYPGDFPESYGPTRTTETGVRIAGAADPAAVDAVIDATLACHRELAPLTPEERKAADCYRDEGLWFPSRSQLVVRIDPNWHPRCHPRQYSEQYLDVEAPASGCRAKGREPTPDCPCRWRAGFREARGMLMLDVTPDLEMLPDPLTRLVTGCRNPWAVPRLANCARPKL